MNFHATCQVCLVRFLSLLTITAALLIPHVSLGMSGRADSNGSQITVLEESPPVGPVVVEQPSAQVQERETSFGGFDADLLPETFGGLVASFMENELSMYRLITIDGGGIRGVFPAKIIEKLDQQIKANILNGLNRQEFCDLRTRNYVLSMPFADYFKGGFTGTSTGSLISLGLTRKEPLPPKDIINLYIEGAEDIFPSCCRWKCRWNLFPYPGCWAWEAAWEAHNPCGDGCQGSWSQRLWCTATSLFTCFGCFGCCYNCAGFCGPEYSRRGIDEQITQKLSDDRLFTANVPVQASTYNLTDDRIEYLGSIDAKTNAQTFANAARCSSAGPTYLGGVALRITRLSEICIKDFLLTERHPLRSRPLIDLCPGVDGGVPLGRVFIENPENMDLNELRLGKIYCGNARLKDLIVVDFLIESGPESSTELEGEFLRKLGTKEEPLRGELLKIIRSKVPTQNEAEAESLLQTVQFEQKVSGSSYEPRAVKEFFLKDLLSGEALEGRLVVQKENRPINLGNFSIGQMRLGNIGNYFVGIDGGVFDNSPTMAGLSQAMRAMRRYFSKHPACIQHNVHDFFLVSLGTGQSIAGIPRPGLQHAGKLRWATPAIDIGIEGGGQALDWALKDILGQQNYVRLQGYLPPFLMPMDKASNVQSILDLAERYCTEGVGKDAIDAVAKRVAKEYSLSMKVRQYFGMLNVDNMYWAARFLVREFDLIDEKHIQNRKEDVAKLYFSNSPDHRRTPIENVDEETTKKIRGFFDVLDLPAESRQFLFFLDALDVVLFNGQGTRLWGSVC